MKLDTRKGALGARQIYEALRDQIVSGVYGSDGLLPSSRALAGELAVSRTTITAAYEQLSAEGFIDVRQGARPRVAPAVVDQNKTVQLPRIHGPTRLSDYGNRLKSISQPYQERRHNLIVDFKYGDLALSDFPALAWKRAVNTIMANSPDRLSYSDPKGSRRLRCALQGYLWRARTLRCNPDQIIVVNGSQQGLDVCARLLLDERDSFVVENPCYTSARYAFRATGAALIPINVDEYGMETQHLAGHDARLAYVTPSHQYPLGGVMPIGRRHQLLAWARQRDAYIIEDDYDGEYRYDINPVPPLYGLESTENVIYVGTISKTLSPALRLGYLVVPSQLQDAFALAKQLADRHTPTMEQEALATLIESGTYESHVRRVRRRNGERRAVLLSALRQAFGDRVAIEGADAGLHIVVWFRDFPSSMENDLVEAILTRSVGAYPVTSLYEPNQSAIRPDFAGLVLGYAALTSPRIERGIRLMGQAVNDFAAERRSSSAHS